VSVIGTVDVTSGTLQFVLPGDISGLNNQTFTLIMNDNADAIIGSFTGLTRGGPNDSASFAIGQLAGTLYYSYDASTFATTGGNDLAVAFVAPEPSGLSLLGLGTAVLLARRRNYR